VCDGGGVMGVGVSGYAEARVGRRDERSGEKGVGTCMREMKRSDGVELGVKAGGGSEC